MSKKQSGLGNRTAKALEDSPMVDKTDRQRTTLYLNKANYEAFKLLCKKRGKTTSEIVDLMIADALEIYQD